KAPATHKPSFSASPAHPAAIAFDIWHPPFDITPMVEINVTYQGQLRTSATHGPSGNTLITDAPKDNMGKGEAFSPTDLVATALATCILTTMGIVAQRNNIDMAGATARVTKEMVTSPIRRIGRLAVTIRMPMRLSDED